MPERMRNPARQYWRNRVWARFAAPILEPDFDGVAAYCMFVGYARSGHTLHGALLDAHPDAVIGSELDALRYVKRGIGRDELFALLVRQSRWFRSRGCRRSGYDYSVPGQWQGRYRSIRVIGDKKGGGSTSLLLRSPRLLDSLRRLVRVPLRIIHMVRNPFDNISTLARRGNWSIERAAGAYFRMAGANERIVASCDPTEILVMRHEDFIADPRGKLAELAAFTGLGADESWLSAAAGIVYESPSRSREKVSWKPGQVAGIQARIDRHPLLQGYGFDR